MVGLLFEICIVDASIFVVRPACDCGWVVLFRDCVEDGVMRT